ncbi:MAG: divergent polysaccharide deacetylase family protein [Holophaga sp.]|nr:divergent polysaccharide deacetylase family protein [Holophaga sp.]
MAGRQTRRTSTPRLAGWAIFMFLVGIGLGALLTSRGCSARKHRLPGEEQTEPARPAPRRERPKPAPQEPPAPAPAPEPVPVPVPVPPPGKTLPRVSLVIDDLGYAPPELVSRLCAQPIPFDVAVLPYQEFTRQSAEIAHARGKEVMLHLPMEPRGYPGPGKDPGPNAVLFDLTEAQVRERVRQALAAIPFRKGVNNHMGSRITPDQARMTWVLEEIKAKHCFFVDSRTEKDSVAFDVARDLAVPSVQRKVFLDDDKDAAAITKQWERMLALARTQGQVLAIGHIYPETVAILEKLVPAAKGRVTFVNASALAN